MGRIKAEHLKLCNICNKLKDHTSMCYDIRVCDDCERNMVTWFIKKYKEGN